MSLRDADSGEPVATDLNSEDRHMLASLPDLVRELLSLEAERDELARELQNLECSQPW